MKNKSNTFILTVGLALSLFVSIIFAIFWWIVDPALFTVNPVNGVIRVLVTGFIPSLLPALGHVLSRNSSFKLRWNEKRLKQKYWLFSLTGWTGLYMLFAYAGYLRNHNQPEAWVIAILASLGLGFILTYLIWNVTGSARTESGS